MADKKTVSKFFRIATEGATTDGRTIDRAWLTQMAANYDPKKYGARVNLEHIRGTLPDSPFKSYGDVIALKAEQNAAGKMELFAQIDPTPELVSMTKARQKIYSSMEVQPDFAKTGQAYLVGLAVTDSPASLGTEMLQFSASAKTNPLAARKQSPENIFSAAEEALIEFEEIGDDSPGLLDKVKALFAKTATSADARFADVHAAVEAIAAHQASQQGSVAQQFADLKTANDKLAQDHAQLAAEFTALQTQLAKAPEGSQRPPATGGNGDVKTDC